MSTSNVDASTQRAADILMAKKTGHSPRPVFADWVPASTADMPLEQRKAALVVHQERLSAVRKEARATFGMLSRSNFDMLGKMQQDVVGQFRALKIEEQSIRGLSDYVIEIYRDRIGKLNWQVLIDRAYALHQLASAKAEDPREVGREKAK